MKQSKEQIDRSHLIGFGMLLSLLGGMMDAYSYIVRGGVFATGHTGNLVLLAVGIARRDYSRTIRSLIPITAFCLGVLVANHIFTTLREKKKKYTTAEIKAGVLLTEAVFLFLVGFVPDNVFDIIPNTMISFIASVQYCSFRHVEGGNSYASVVFTGNVRSFMDKVYEGFVLKKLESRAQARNYGMILLGFLCGVFLETLLASTYGEQSIWWASGIAVLCGLSVRGRVSV